MNIVAEAIDSAAIAPAPARTGETVGTCDMRTRYRAPTMPEWQKSSPPRPARSAPTC
jgi:hypothetical protein